MPYGVWRSDLRTHVRERAHMEASTFVTDAELNRYIDQSAKLLYNKLIKAHSGDYNTTETNLSTSVGVGSYFLPADFYQLVSIHAQVGGTWGRIRKFMPQEEDRYLNASSIGSAGDLGYRLTGTQNTELTNLEAKFDLRPVPQAVFPVRVRYIPICWSWEEEAADDDVEYDGVNGFEEWIIWNVVAICLAKEESDPSFALAQRAAIEQEIAELADARDAGQPDRVVDVRRELGGAEDLGHPGGWWAR